MVSVVSVCTNFSDLRTTSLQHFNRINSQRTQISINLWRIFVGLLHFSSFPLLFRVYLYLSVLFLLNLFRFILDFGYFSIEIFTAKSAITQVLVLKLTLHLNFNMNQFNLIQLNVYFYFIWLIEWKSLEAIQSMFLSVFFFIVYFQWDLLGAIEKKSPWDSQTDNRKYHKQHNKSFKRYQVDWSML